MGLPGKKIRLNRIFGNDGRTLIVPIDHGLGSGPVAGLEQASKIIETLVSGGVDAILTAYGVAKKFAPVFGRLGLILRMDGGPTDLAKDPENTDLMCTVEDALRLGADAVITSIWLGGDHETRTMKLAMKLAGQCEEWGMPLIVETFMSSGVEINIEHIALVSRVAAELGADVVKTYLRGDAKAFRRVTDTCFRPIVILGGERSDDELQALKWVKTAIDAGAAGSCIGRNVFQHRNPAGLIKALRAIVHDGAKVEEVSSMM